MLQSAQTELSSTVVLLAVSPPPPAPRFINRRESSPLKMVDFGLAQFCRPGQHFNERWDLGG